MKIEYTLAYFSVISFGAFFPKLSFIVDLNNENYMKMKISSIHLDSNIGNIKCKYNFQAIPSTPEEKQSAKEESEYKFQFVNRLFSIIFIIIIIIIVIIFFIIIVIIIFVIIFITIIITILFSQVPEARTCVRGS